MVRFLHDLKRLFRAFATGQLVIVILGQATCKQVKDDRVIVYGKDTHHVSLLRMRGALAGALGAFSQKTTYAGQQ